MKYLLLIELVQLYSMETICILLGIICVLLFCLFSPNIVMFIHKKWFKWKN